MQASANGSSSVRNVLVVVSDERQGESLHRELNTRPGLRCAGIATTLGDGIDMLRPGSLQAVLLSDALPDAGVWNAVRAFRDLDPATTVVVIADQPGLEAFREARYAGASAFVSTDTPFDLVAELLRRERTDRMVVDADAVLAMVDEGPAEVGVDRTNGSGARTTLTPRELEVLRLLGRGLDPSGIAAELGLSVHTARGHVKRILAKLGVHSQLEAVITAVQLGLLPQLGRG